MSKRRLNNQRLNNQRLMELLCFFNDSHCAGEGVLPFLCDCTKEATQYRGVCKEFKHAIACFPWKKGPGIKRRFSSWHECFPNAVNCTIVTDHLRAEDVPLFKDLVQLSLVSSFEFVAHAMSFPLLGRARYVILQYSASIEDDEVRLRATAVVAEHCLNLQILKLDDCTDDMLLNLQRCPKLVNLWFNDDDEVLISSEGLAQFGQCKPIQVLTIDYTTEAMCVAIADNFPALTSFSTFSIEDVSEKSLVRLVKNCPDLFRVWIEHVDMPMQELLLALSCHPKITDIWMTETPVTDKGVFALLQSKSLRNLVLTYYEGTLSEACKAALFKRFPFCFN